MTEKHLDRLRKLVALSASDQIEEARTAAHMACALIREHNLLDRLGRAPAAVSAPAGTRAWTWNDIVRQAEDDERARRNRSRTPYGAPPPPPASAGARVTQHDFDPKLEWVRMQAKHSGACRVCRKRAEQGSTIYWKKGAGVMHHACAPWNTANQQEN